MAPPAPQEPTRPPLPTPDRGDARRAIDHALAADPSVEEQLAREPALAGGDAFLDSIWSWFENLVAGIDALRGTAPVLYWLVMTAMVLVLALLLMHIGWTVRSAVRGARAAAARQAATAVDVADRRRGFDELRGRAREAADAGATRDAVRLLVLALLARCDERDVLHAAGSWTLREIVKRLALGTPRDIDVATFGHRAERAVYGVAEPSPHEFDALDADLAELVAALDHDTPAEAVA